MPHQSDRRPPGEATAGSARRVTYAFSVTPPFPPTPGRQPAVVSPTTGRVSSWKLWLAALGLLAPVGALYVTHYAHGWAVGQVPTGFLQYDMAGYMAAAREHFDGGGFTLTYGNPASPDPNTPRIYFQPMTLVLAVAARLPVADPGVVFVVFGLLTGWVALRLAIAVFDELFGLDTPAKRAALVCFVWGGGLLVISGAAYGLLTTGRPEVNLLRFDPNEGWWFLNFGRNLVYPTEALYHALALACLLALLRRRFGVALAVLAVLSASHPFTGIQVIGVVFAWLLVERLVVRSPGVPWWTVTVAALLAAAHLGYYMVFLPRFEEHAALVAQWKLDARLEWFHMLPAYLLVAGLAAWRCRGAGRCREVFADPRNRLLAVWFGVSLLLANHEWFFPPHQPLHFTRGYLWMPLFLLGAPVLFGGIQRCGDAGGKRETAGEGEQVGVGCGAWGGVWAWLIMGVFLLDNTVWLTAHGCRPTGLYLQPGEWQALQRIDAETGPDVLLVADPPLLAYLATVYTPHRAWFSHWANTPHAVERGGDLRRYLADGAIPDGWRGREVVILAAARGELQPLFDAAAQHRPGLRIGDRSGRVAVWRDGSLAGH